MEPSVSEVADGACCERDEGINKVHSLLNNSKTLVTNHKNRSVGILLQGSEPQEDTSLIMKDFGIQNIQEELPSRSRFFTLWTVNTGIRRAAPTSRIEKSKVFLEKKSRITAGGLCANSTNAINHVDSTLNCQILE